MPEGEARKRPARRRIGVRRPLAREVGEEEEALGRRRPRGGFGEEPLVGDLRRDRVAQPAQRPRGREHDAHRLPGGGNGMAEGVEARLGVGGEALLGGEDDSRRPQRDR